MTQKWNIYSYVSNNPVMSFDPNGMDERAAKPGFFRSYANAFVGGFKAMGHAIAHPVATAKAAYAQEQALSKMSIGAQMKARMDSALSSNPMTSGLYGTAKTGVALAQGDTSKAGATLGATHQQGVTDAALMLAGEGLGKALTSTTRATEALADGAGGAGKVERVLQGIDDVGAKVKINPLNPDTLQEANATIKLPDGRSVNVRVETHPIPGSDGVPVRHGNVDVLAPAKNKTVPISETHVTN